MKSELVRRLQNRFSSLESFLFFDEIPAWPFFGTRQYCSSFHSLRHTHTHTHTHACNMHTINGCIMCRACHFHVEYHCDIHSHVHTHKRARVRLRAYTCTQGLTRSLPRDVYIRRQNDHPGGQGRIYTSHLNFVSTHLSKPGHRRGCCCMSPRCLFRQFVDRCLLFWAFFIEKTVLLCFARFLSKWRETALWLFPDATSWYELYV